MNADIRISTGLFGNTKIKRLIRRKGSDGFVSLQKLWIWAAIHRPTGVLSGMEDGDLMDVLETNDEAMVALLVGLNLLDHDGKCYSIHNWMKHNLWASGAEKRADSARKAAQIRWSNKVADMKKNSQ